jgi:hypothetical protein
MNIVYGALLLAAFGLGWYLCQRQYESQVQALRDWVLRLIEDYSAVTDMALHMKRDHDFTVDSVHEAARDEIKLPVIDGQLGAFIDRIEHPDVRDSAINQSRKAMLQGMEEAQILEHLRAGEDPLWARAIGD